MRRLWKSFPHRKWMIRLLIWGARWNFGGRDSLHPLQTPSPRPDILRLNGAVSKRLLLPSTCGGGKKLNRGERRRQQMKNFARQTEEAEPRRSWVIRLKAQKGWLSPRTQKEERPASEGGRYECKRGHLKVAATR